MGEIFGMPWHWNHLMVTALAILLLAYAEVHTGTLSVVAGLVGEVLWLGASAWTMVQHGTWIGVAFVFAVWLLSLALAAVWKRRRRHEAELPRF